MKKMLIVTGLVVALITSGRSDITVTDTNTNVNIDKTGTDVPIDTFLLKVGAAAQGTIDYQNKGSITVLVNKENELSADYIPNDLVDVRIPFIFKEQAEKRKMRQEAASKLEELFAAGKEQHIILYGVSGYRSYQTQTGLFASFVRRYGSEDKANQISARPGQSEHQTGLAMDVTSQSVNYGLEETFANTPEYSWLTDNAHLFGFIIRYPKGKEYLTEYTFEPWHLRYVGQELATMLYEHDITYEEFLFFKI